MLSESGICVREKKSFFLNILCKEIFFLKLKLLIVNVRLIIYVKYDLDICIDIKLILFCSNVS